MKPNLKPMNDFSFAIPKKNLHQLNSTNLNAKVKIRGQRFWKTSRIFKFILSESQANAEFP